MGRKKWSWVCDDKKYQIMPFEKPLLDPDNLLKTWRREKSIGVLLLPDLWALIRQYLLPRFRRWVAVTSYDDQDHKWQSLPPFPSPLRSFFLRLEWSDQGWGNRKGRFKIKLIRDLVVILEETWFDVAPHTRTLQEMSLTREDKHKSQLLDLADKNDILEIWYHGGGSGGHELIIYHLSVRIEPII